MKAEVICHSNESLIVKIDPETARFLFGSYCIRQGTMIEFESEIQLAKDNSEFVQDFRDLVERVNDN